jgi:hypothetical protein
MAAQPIYVMTVPLSIVNYRKALVTLAGGQLATTPKSSIESIKLSDFTKI